MMYRRLVSALTLLAFVGCTMVLPATVFAQNYNYNNQGSDRGVNYWNNNYGTNAQMTQGGGMLRKIVPGLIGGVAGFFLGAQFGIVGKIAGAAVGFFLAKWVFDKFFPSDVYTYSDYQNNNSFQWQQQNNYGQGYTQYPPYRRSETGVSAPTDTNLQALREAWFTATRTYQTALTSNDQAQIESTRTAYEAARTAYYGAIQTNYSR
jgi:hypothetical protein